MIFNKFLISKRKRYRVTYLKDKTMAIMLGAAALILTIHAGRILYVWGIRYDECNKRYYYFKEV